MKQRRRNAKKEDKIKATDQNSFQRYVLMVIIVFVIGYLLFFFHVHNLKFEDFANHNDNSDAGKVLTKPSIFSRRRNESYLKTTVIKTSQLSTLLVSSIAIKHTNTIKDNRRVCTLNPSVGSNYAFNASEALRFCILTADKYRVMPGHSWGGLAKHKELRTKWIELDCNGILKRGSELSCSEKHGKVFLEFWMKDSVDLCGARKSLTANHVCRKSNLENWQCSFAPFQLNLEQQFISAKKGRPIVATKKKPKKRPRVRTIDALTEERRLAERNLGAFASGDASNFARQHVQDHRRLQSIESLALQQMKRFKKMQNARNVQRQQLDSTAHNGRRAQKAQQGNEVGDGRLGLSIQSSAASKAVDMPEKVDVELGTRVFKRGFAIAGTCDASGLTGPGPVEAEADTALLDAYNKLREFFPQLSIYGSKKAVGLLPLLQPVSQPISQPILQPISQSVEARPAAERVMDLVNQSTSQPIFHPISQSLEERPAAAAAAERVMDLVNQSAVVTPIAVAADEPLVATTPLLLRANVTADGHSPQLGYNIITDTNSTAVGSASPMIVRKLLEKESSNVFRAVDGIISVEASSSRSSSGTTVGAASSVGSSNDDGSELSAAEALTRYAKEAARVAKAVGGGCDVYVVDPAIIVSHDSLTNLGHLFQDLMNWWLVAELLGLDPKHAVLVSIDGLRPGSIMHGVGRHVPDMSAPDSLGPFRRIFEVLFGAAVGAVDEWGSKRVCFKQVHLYPMPLRGFLWEHFELTDRCSLELQASRLYQRFAHQYLSAWKQYGDLEQLRLKWLPPPPPPPPQQQQQSIDKGAGNAARLASSSPLWSLLSLPQLGIVWPWSSRQNANNATPPAAAVGTTNKSDAAVYAGSAAAAAAAAAAAVPAAGSKQAGASLLRVLLIARKERTSDLTPETRARVMANELEVRQVLQKARAHFQLLEVDFGELSLEEQVALASTVDVLVGFHGAGINHMFHMDPARERCCGVIELFPQALGCDEDHRFVCVISRRQGHGNHARFLGYRYSSFIAAEGSLREVGTEIDPLQLLAAILQMKDDLAAKPTCVAPDSPE